MKKYAVIIAGPSGSGKTTVAEALIASLGTLEMSRSATTREKRGDGKDDEYIYLSVDEFKQSISNGDMLEHTEYSENFYGTRKSEFERIWNLNKNPILVLDYNGVASLKSRLDIPVLAFYIYTTLEEAEQRLIARDFKDGSDEKKLATLKKRIKANLYDYGQLGQIYGLFDAYIANESVDSCVSEIENAISQLLSGKSVMNDEEKIKITDSFKRNAESWKAERE